MLGRPIWVVARDREVLCVGAVGAAIGLAVLLLVRLVRFGGATVVAAALAAQEGLELGSELSAHELCDLSDLNGVELCRQAWRRVSSSTTSCGRASA